jgi:hypothetical protein
MWGGSPLRKPWVAELVGRYPSKKYIRNFLQGSINYEKSNGCGSRGVELSFILETDRLYQVHNNVSWKKSVDRFFAVTEAGDLKELTVDEAMEWLNLL